MPGCHQVAQLLLNSPYAWPCWEGRPGPCDPNYTTPLHLAARMATEVIRYPPGAPPASSSSYGTVNVPSCPCPTTPFPPLLWIALPTG